MTDREEVHRIQSQFHTLPLADRIASAYEVLLQLNERMGHPPHLPWSLDILRETGIQIRATEEAKEAEEREIQELAEDLAVSAGWNHPDHLAVKRARDLYKWGYRKVKKSD